MSAACMQACTLAQPACMRAPDGIPAERDCCRHGRKVLSRTGWDSHVVAPGTQQAGAGTLVAHKQEVVHGKRQLVLGMGQQRVRGKGQVCRVRAGTGPAGRSAPVARSRTCTHQRDSRSWFQARLSLCWRGSQWHRLCIQRSCTDHRRPRMSRSPFDCRNYPVSRHASAYCHIRHRLRNRTRRVAEGAVQEASEKSEK